MVLWSLRRFSGDLLTECTDPKGTIVVSGMLVGSPKGTEKLWLEHGFIYDKSELYKGVIMILCKSVVVPFWKNMSVSLAQCTFARIQWLHLLGGYKRYKPIRHVFGELQRRKGTLNKTKPYIHIGRIIWWFESYLNYTLHKIMIEFCFSYVRLILRFFCSSKKSAEFCAVAMAIQR